MQKKTVFVSIIFGTVLFASVAYVALAKPDFKEVTVNPSGKVISVPETAIEMANHVFSLGSAVDPVSGKIVEGYAIVHPKEAKAKGGKPGKPGKPDAGSQCYDFLAKGAKWKAVEPWVMNPTNLSMLDENTVFNNLADSIAKWEDAADGVVDGNMGADILGNGTSTLDNLIADTASPDGLNEVLFGDISDEGAIAITIVWGVFGGRPALRELVEWDQVFDDVDYEWSVDGEAGMMDFENIATHELGHSVGMGHPDDNCLEETMYRFADVGETKKRDLNSGDIAGVNDLY